MRLETLGANQTQITLTNGDTILFSYNTPVAMFNRSNCVYYRTNKKWSVTTSRHINKWLQGSEAVLPKGATCKVVEKDQSFFDELIKQTGV